MGKCSNCGEELDGDEKYCPRCGGEIKRKSVTVENKSEKENPNSSSSGFGRLLFLIIIIGVGAFLLPKAPAIMTALGIEGAPGVEPLEVESTSVEFGNLEDGLVLNMRVHNPNMFNADLGRVTYDVTVAGDQVASGQKDTYESISAGSTSTITSDIDVDFGGALGAGAGIIGNAFSGEASYVKIEGQWHYKVGPASFSIPFEDRSQL